MESSVIFLIGKYCINKQQKDKWVNTRQVESETLSCVRVFKPNALIQVLWLPVTSKVGCGFLELFGGTGPELLLSYFIILYRDFRKALGVVMYHEALPLRKEVIGRMGMDEQG